MPDVAPLEERGYDFDAWARSSAVELRTFNPGVVGSNPTGPSIEFLYGTVTLQLIDASHFYVFENPKQTTDAIVQFLEQSRR